MVASWKGFLKEEIMVKNIQSRTNLNGGELERILRRKRRMIKIQSRTNLNGGELERISRRKRG